MTVGRGRLATRVGVQVHGELAEVPAADWDRLVGGDGFYESHDWLRFVETELAEPPSYILCGEPGAWRGALTLYRDPLPLASRCGGNDFQDLLGFNGEALFAGASRGYRTTLPCPPGPRQSETLAALVQTALAEAERSGRAGVVLPFLTTSALRALAGAVRVRAAFHLPEAELVGCAQGLAAYADRASPSVRNKIRSDQARFGRSGWVIRERKLADCWREAARLLYQVEQKYGHVERTSQWLERSVASQADRLATRSVAFTCEDEHGIAGINVCYRWRETLFVRFAGFDYERLRAGREYFSTVIYAALRYAGESGISRVHLGTGSWEAKGYRGAVLRPLWSALVPAGVGWESPGLELAHSQTVRQWQAEIASRNMRIDPEDWRLPGLQTAMGTA